LEPSAEFLAFKKKTKQKKIGDQKPQDTLTFFALLENNSQELLFFPSQFVAIFTKKR
jgi:hypothetical protein